MVGGPLGWLWSSLVWNQGQQASAVSAVGLQVCEHLLGASPGLGSL